MKNTKNTFRTSWFIGALTLLSAGVLLGCEYCGPLLLATITGTVVYCFTKLAGETMQVKSISN